MQPRLLIFLLVAIVAGTSCEKEFSYTESASVKPPEVIQPVTPVHAVLVDASKDGGGWWFPQAGTFSANEPHQGKALADYIRGLGFRVDELGRGVTVKKELLNKYKYVIRATAFFPYTEEEILAYETFLNRPTSLLLFTDHLLNSPNDALSIKLGLNFSGAYTSEVSFPVNHPVTEGASPLAFISGSVIQSLTNMNKIVPLGFISVPGNIDNLNLAMGILRHPSSKILFIGDINGMELVPQPLTKNLLNWLFPK